jgi:hypothetical protein
MKSTHSGLSFAGLLSLIVLVALAACSGADETALSPTPDVTQVYQTVNARLTEAVILTPSVTAPPVPAATSTSQTATPTLSVTLVATLPSAGNPTQPGNCDLAGAGNPIDISIPDDTRMQPGQAFTKIWRLQNLGTCTWTSSYLAGHFSGQMMTLQGTVPLPQQVPPGGSIDLAVDMVAPQAPGTYQSNWKLQNPQGGWFGIGPNGGAPFWVRIIVEPLPTATVTLVSPTASPTTTSTPTLQATGSVTLQPMQKFDLDQAGAAGGEDIAYETNAGGQHLVIPQGSTVMAVMGNTQPGWGNCRTANMSAQPVVVENLPAGSYLCYRTSLGLPGWARLGSVNGNDGSLLLDYLTWSIP